MAVLKGPDGYLLIAGDANPITALDTIATQDLATLLANTNGAGAAAWHELCNVTDVEGNFTDNESDVTTRCTARAGWDATDIISRKGEFTFPLLNDPADIVAQLLIKAWNERKHVAAWDLDQNPFLATDAAPVKGLAGNFSVGMRKSGQVGGNQIFNVTMKVVSYPNWHELTAAQGATLGGLCFTDGVALVNPNA